MRWSMRFNATIHAAPYHFLLLNAFYNPPPPPSLHQELSLLQRTPIGLIQSYIIVILCYKWHLLRGKGPLQTLWGSLSVLQGLLLWGRSPTRFVSYSHKNGVAILL